MKLVYTENYEATSKEAADLLLDILHKKPDAVICLATGDFPAWIYELVCEAANKERVDLSETTFVRLGKWYGVEPQTARTCIAFIRGHLLDQLYVRPKTAAEFVSDTADVRQELDRMDVFLSEHPVGVMILGLGMNRHLRLSEPADLLTLNVYYAELDERMETHDMVEGYEPRGGLTIRLQGIFTSGQIIMLACGGQKEATYQASIGRRIATSTPAPLLWLHPNCVTLVDGTIQK